ncbi:Microsomal signal peptidase Spc12 [Penicillium verhagenii]|nr:Microsomal signal peptidase Spc12 [Penicillium verhagenii]
MDELLAPIQDALEGQIDFHGQRLAELLSTILLVASFLIGYIYKDMYLTLWVGLGGTLFTALAVIPPWPIYNQNPEKWLNKDGSSRGPQVVVDGVKVA